MALFELKILSAILILLMAVIAAWIPFRRRIIDHQKRDFPMGEALAAGVFLGAGLIHMLSDSTADFSNAGYHYPFAFLLAGITFLFMLWLEHLGREFYHHHGEQSSAFAVLAIFMLSLHSFLAGTALGVSANISVFIIILLAILAHKWAAGFALAVYINKSSLKTTSGLIGFIIFALCTPAGILFGELITKPLGHSQLIEPVFTALAAGTFIYLGTLHGLTRAVMIKQCCNLKYFSFVVLGFLLMGLVAIWA